MQLAQIDIEKLGEDLTRYYVFEMLPLKAEEGYITGELTEKGEEIITMHYLHYLIGGPELKAHEAKHGYHVYQGYIQFEYPEKGVRYEQAKLINTTEGKIQQEAYRRQYFMNKFSLPEPVSSYREIGEEYYKKI